MLPIPVLLTVGLVGLLAGFQQTARLTDRELAMSGAIVEAYPRCPPALADEIVLTSRHIGADPAELANLVRFETAHTFSGRVRHPSSGATGVIQFMPSTARALGTTVEAIAQRDYPILQTVISILASKNFSLISTTRSAVRWLATGACRWTVDTPRPRLLYRVAIGSGVLKPVSERMPSSTAAMVTRRPGAPLPRSSSTSKSLFGRISLGSLMSIFCRFSTGSTAMLVRPKARPGTKALGDSRWGSLKSNTLA